MNTTDPFAYIDGLTDATDLNPLDSFLRVAIVGKPKVGKSWMAATVPGNAVIHYDFDGRKDSLAVCQATKGRTYKIKTVRDNEQSSPTAMKSIEADLSTFKAAKAQGNPVPDAYVFDSVTYMKVAMDNELMSQSSNLRRSVKLGLAKQLWIPAGWDAINASRGYADYIFNEFSRLGHVVFVFHQRDEKDKAASTEAVTAYTGRQTISPQFWDTILALFNEVFYIDVEPYSGKYQVQTKINNDVSAATTLLIDPVEVPNIQDMLAKHKLAVAQNQNKQLKLGEY